VQTIVKAFYIQLLLGIAWQVGSPPMAAASIHVGAPLTAENLTVFPMHGERDPNPMALTTLDAALAKGDAEVREVGGGAEVNRLVVQNKGKLPIYVLAGTVVKGGNQDRQISQDFIIERGQKVAVDAFCVEHGRWSGERAGRRTNGKFSETKGLAQSEVRRAAQYKGDQGEVWNKVAEVNAAHKKSAPSGTLLATLDDAEFAKRRGALVKTLDAALGGVEAQAPVVGFGYAVDGQVRNVRWFQSPSAFALFRQTLLETAVLDALTAQGRHGKRSAPKVEPAAVDGFMREIEAAKPTMRETAAQNRNEYKEGKVGFGSKTRFKSRPAESAPVSQDYTAK
jgi:hypothetical protein